MELRVALCQTDMERGAVAGNLQRAEEAVAAAGADLTVLPETFASGFAARPQRAADSADRIVEWMRRTARRYGTALAGSVVVRSGERFVNRLYFVRPTGGTEWYDKRHLFSIGGEGECFAAGDRRVVVEYGGVRWLLLICYDLRFPVWCRCRDDYDAILCAASWPASRREAWRTLLRARAIENQAYVVGVNRTGDDPPTHYAGDSAVVDFMGRTLCEAGSAACVRTVAIDSGAPSRFRAEFPVRRDADDFRLSVR